MSTVVIKIEENQLSALKKFIRTVNAKMRVITDEEDIMEKLVEEGLKSKAFSLKLLKDELAKDAGRR